MRFVRISLMGHKDHGKSTLIGRLLHDTHSITQDRINEAIATSKALGKNFEYAFLLDSFEEEREGGFTLDTTRAQVKHGGVIYELIDVPGHRELVKNMLSGVSLAHAAILVVSASEGLESETRLHAYLARLLGIERLVVAVNKMDAVGHGGKEFAALKAAMEDTLAGLGFDAAKLSFVPVSAMNGDNLLVRSRAMPWYEGKTVMEHMEDFSRFDADAELLRLPARMFVQDVYDDVVAGRLETGKLATGDEIEVEPAGAKAKIAQMYVAGRQGDSAHAGQNVGLKLSPTLAVGRGCVCMAAGPHARPVKKLRARIFCFGSHLDVLDAVHLTSATQESMARISAIMEKLNPISGAKPVKGAGRVGMFEGGEVELELEKPLMLERFADMPPTGRFVLSKDGRIVAAGIVP